MNEKLLSGAIYVLEAVNPRPLVTLDPTDILALANLIFFVFLSILLTTIGRAAVGHVPEIGDGVILVLALCIASVSVVMAGITGLTVIALVMYGLTARALDGVLFGYAVACLFRRDRRLAAGLTPTLDQVLPTVVLVVSCVLIARSLSTILSSIPLLREAVAMQSILIVTCICGIVVIPNLPDNSLRAVHLILFPVCTVAGLAGGIRQAA